MVYIEVQDKKLKFGMKKKELQSISFDWYSIDWKSFDWYSIGARLIESRISAKISKHKKAITYSFETQIASRFF